LTGLYLDWLDIRRTTREGSHLDQLVSNNGRMTVEAFLDAYASEDGRYELVAGVPVLLGDTTVRQSRVSTNLAASLYNGLSRDCCEVFGVNMGLKIGEYDLRLPAAAIYCDTAELAAANDMKRYLECPRVFFEFFHRPELPATGKTGWSNTRSFRVSTQL